MKVRFWGVRGSIPVPGPRTVRYGGNTTCIEVRTSDNRLIILDAGTGIYPLSMSLFPELPIDAHIFNTHSHWDHIHGLPFYIPLFIPGNRVTLYGAADPITMSGISDILSIQMQYRYFPVREVELKADLLYRTLSERESVRIGAATVTPFLLNHPVTNYGYRIEEYGKSVFFTGDHEQPYNIFSPDDPEFAEYEALLRERRSAIVECMRDVDLLIADSAYAEHEYSGKRGWGHGTFPSSIELARRARARHLVFTHHEPNRDDDSLERVFHDALAARTALADEPKYTLAYEGLTIEV